MTRFSPLVIGLLLAACTATEDEGPDGGQGGGSAGSTATGGEGGSVAPPAAFRVALGSCSYQHSAQPILYDVVAAAPDLFVYLGDNIYGDTLDMGILQAQYNALAIKREFQTLWNATEVLAVWDDHDYGQNDAGKSYPMKEESKQVFLDFWQVPADSDRRQHEGIYTAHTFGPEGYRLQLLLLDMRTFRDDLVPAGNDPQFKNDYQPNDDPSATMLGDAQWIWLEEQLQQPAQVRLIASSTQFGISYNGYEAWANVPHERQRMVDLIRDTNAHGVIFMSGDVHYGELSKLESAGVYPLYDLTSSGLTETWPWVEDNDNRIGDAEPRNNFGVIDIDWQMEDPQIDFRIHNIDGEVAIQHTISLSELTLPN